MQRSLMKEEDQLLTSEDYGYEQDVRNEMMRACGLAKQLEQHLMMAPYGSLVEPSNHELRVSFCRLSFDTATSFHNVIMLLESKFGLQQPEASTSWSKARIPLGKKNARRKHLGEADGPAVGRKNWCALPLSPPRAASAGALHTTSPPPSSSDISEGSPARPGSLEMDSGDPVEPAAAGRSAGQKIEYAEGFEEHGDGDGDGGRKPENLRERKPLRKITIRVPCVSLDQGNEMLPDDGHLWRKYGQKEIVGRRYPRSYYRCTHRDETGCTALKYVQKSDENPRFFDVTYRSHHNCQPSQLDASFWTVGGPLLSIYGIECSPASQYSQGCIGFSPSPPVPSHLFRLPILSSLTSNPPENVSVSLQPSDISSFSAPAITPNLGSAAVHKVKLEHALNLPVNDDMLNTSDQLNNLVLSENFQPFATACCNSSGITIEPNQISTLSGEFERGATEVPGYNDDVFRELENYCMTEQASADCRLPLEPPPIFHPFVSTQPNAAEKSIYRDHTERSLASEAEIMQPEPFPLFADDLLYMEEY